jgi:phage-related protein
MSGVGDKADAVGSASSQAAGGIGDLGGALSLMPGPLGAVGAGMEAAAPAIMGVTGAADLLNLATTKFPALAKAQTIATNVLAGAQRALNAVMAGNPIALVVLAIVALIGIMAVLYNKNEGFRDLVNAVFGKFRDVVQTAKEKFVDFAGAAVEKIGNVIGKFGDFRERVAEAVGAAREKLQSAGEKFGDLREAARNAIGTYSADGGGVLGKVHDIVSNVGNLPGIIRDKAAGVFGPVKDAADNAIGTYSAEGGGVLGKLHNIVSTVTGLGGTITSKAAGMWDGIGSAFKGVINNMIGWWNNLSFSVDIPDKIPGLPDSFTISTPNIPYLADGGIVNRATLAVIGEAGPEAVIPLDRLRGLGTDRISIDLTLTPEILDTLLMGKHYATSIAVYNAHGGVAEVA